MICVGRFIKSTHAHVSEQRLVEATSNRIDEAAITTMMIRPLIHGLPGAPGQTGCHDNGQNKTA